LNRFESLPAKSRCRQRAVRGGGGLNPWAVWGPLPHGVSRTDFFWSTGSLNYFSEIKEIKRPSADRSRASRVFSRHWIRCLGLSPRQIAPNRVLFFGHVAWGEGVVKSLGSSGGDRCRTNTSADFQIRHGVVLGQSKNVAKFMVGTWAGVDTRGSFPAVKCCAGGSRARSRQPQPIKNKVDSVDTALRRLTHTVPRRRASGLTWEVS
jgi:hypothetical protein